MKIVIQKWSHSTTFLYLAVVRSSDMGEETNEVMFPLSSRKNPHPAIRALPSTRAEPAVLTQTKGLQARFRPTA